MHFETTKCKYVLGKGRGCPLQHQKIIYTYRPKKGLKFGIFSSPIIKFVTQWGAVTLQPPKSYRPTVFTNLNLKWSLKLWAWIYEFCLTKYNSFYTRGRCLGPLSRALTLDPTRGPYRHALTPLVGSCTSCSIFSLQALSKTWKPCVMDRKKCSY